MSDNVMRIPIAVVVTLCMAVGAGAWAISSEVHNYRFRNVTDRLKSHETSILQLKEESVEYRSTLEYLVKRVDEIYDVVAHAD